MKKILFPTDFSKASLNAFRYALELAHSCDAEIITLHVYMVPAIDQGAEFGAAPYLLETYDILEMSNFENFKGKVPLLHTIAEEQGKGDVCISNVLKEGDLVSNILELIKAEHIDYVVMSTKGASGIEEIFLGTVTAKIMTSTKAVVLGIPESAVFQPVKRIGFATHFKADEVKSLKRVISIAENFNARVDCIYVRTPGDKVNEVVIADWELNFKDKVTFNIIENASVESAIIDFTMSNGINMLAMFNHRHGFFESLFHESRTKKMAYHTHIPLMVMHED
ncbi:universal stress protein [Flavobacterium sp. 3HN19-14]|uniref:universal stress protein n=1 Tax=Flavobacterium sp. 3HN19-14 TaxID=3448133 RepID=UPI003EDECD35